MYHLIPSNIREQKWQEFLQDQLQEHRIAHIREEIINIAIANGPEKNHFEKKLFKFNSQCARIVWLRLFNASIDFLNFSKFLYFVCFLLIYFLVGVLNIRFLSDTLHNWKSNTFDC